MGQPNVKIIGVARVKRTMTGECDDRFSELCRQLNPQRITVEDFGLR